MKKLLSAILAILMMFGCAALADTAAEPVNLGPYLFVPEAGWQVKTTSLVHLYVTDAEGSITSNMEFFEYYSGFGMSYEDLLSSCGDDYGIAMLIVEASIASTYDTTGSRMLATNTIEYTTMNGNACIIYYGELDPGFSEGCYRASLVVTPEGILSNMVFTYDSAVTHEEVENFHNAILCATFDSGVPVMQLNDPASNTGSFIANFNNMLGNTAEEPGFTVTLDAAEITVPAEWTLDYSDGTSANFTCGWSTVSINAFGEGLLLNNMDSLSDEYLHEYLVAAGESTLSGMGISPSSTNFITTHLDNGDPAVFFVADTSIAGSNGTMTCALFVTDENTICMIAVMSPAGQGDTACNLTADAVNLFYPGSVVQAYQIPGIAHADSSGSETAPAVTVPSPNVISVTGTSITGEESSALTDAILYVSTSYFSYDMLIDQLIIDGYSYEIAVFAADNCGVEWEAWE